MVNVNDAEDCAVTILVNGQPYTRGQAETGRVINFPTRQLAATWLNRLEGLKESTQRPD